MSPKKPKTEADHISATRDAVLKAALENVVFDGWGETALAGAIAHAGVEPGLAKLAFPRGAVDLALAFHMDGDAQLAALLATTDLAALRYSERVARAIEMRLELMAGDREAVRRATAFFALPNHAGDGARAIWHTADVIWNGLGDSSTDVNWYTKRATLSAVYSACVLYWLGDDSADQAATKAFVARRIGNVMQFEKLKAQIRKNPLAEAFMRGPGRIMSRIEKPGVSRDDLPGSTRP